MEKHEAIYKSRKQIFFNNFIGGIGWAIGVTIGLAITVIVLGLVLKNINLVPFVGNFIADIIRFVISKEPNLIH